MTLKIIRELDFMSVLKMLLELDFMPVLKDKPLFLSMCCSRPLAAAATSSGDIFVYDLRSQTCLHKINAEQVRKYT